MGHVSGRGSKAEQSDLRESLAGHTAGCFLSTGRAVNQPSTHLYISLSLNGILHLRKSNHILYLSVVLCLCHVSSRLYTPRTQNDRICLALYLLPRLRYSEALRDVAMKTGTVRFTCVRRAELLLLPSLHALISSGSFSRQLCYVSHSHLLMIQLRVAVAAIAKSLLSLSLFFSLCPVFKRLINCACMTASSASQEALQAPDLQAPANSLVICTVPVPGPQRSDIAIRLPDSRTPGASPHARGLAHIEHCARSHSG